MQTFLIDCLTEILSSLCFPCIQKLFVDAHQRMTIFWQPMLDLVEAAKERMPRQGLPALMGPEQALVGIFFYIEWDFELGYFIYISLLKCSILPMLVPQLNDVMVCHGLSRCVDVCLGVLWYVVVCHGVLWFAVV